MKNFNIGQNIMILRKKNNYTQEQLANKLGVTSSAISKWETNNFTPDIGLLVPLARALNTSIDNLFSFKKDISEDEVKNIKKTLTQVFLREGYIVGKKKCMEFLKEYPNNVHLKITIAGLIRMYSIMSENATEEIIKERMKYSLELFYDVVKSNDSKYTSLALYSVAGLEMMLENYTESEKALKELNSSYIDHMGLYVSLLQKQNKSEEAEKLCERMLFQYLNQASCMLSTLSQLSRDNKDMEKAILYLDTLNLLEDKFGFGMGLAPYSYCKLYLRQGNKVLAAKWFKDYINKVIYMPYDYSENIYFKELTLEVDNNGQKIMRKKLVQSLIDSEEFKELVGIDDYEEANNKLKVFIDTI